MTNKMTRKFAVRKKEQRKLLVPRPVKGLRSSVPLCDFRILHFPDSQSFPARRFKQVLLTLIAGEVIHHIFIFDRSMVFLTDLVAATLAVLLSLSLNRNWMVGASPNMKKVSQTFLLFIIRLIRKLHWLKVFVAS